MTASTYVQPEINASSPPLHIAQAGQSGICWAAIFAGALAAVALSILLFMLGVGLGLSSVSAWSGQGVEGDTLGWTAIAWLAVTQLISAGVGGYIAGRLRIRWLGLETNEVYFRDTAHGFLAWSLATLMMVALMGSIAGTALMGTDKTVAGMATAAAADASAGAGAGAGAGAPGTGAPQDTAPDRLSYWIDTLFRQGSAASSTAGDTAQLPQQRSSADMSEEVTRIYARALQGGNLPDEDARHIARLITERTGLSPIQAEQRVHNTFDQIEQSREQTKQMAETARRAAAHSTLWMFVALLIGAFVASLLATWGGRQRDTF